MARADIEITLAASLQDFVQGLNRATQELSGSLSEMKRDTKRGTSEINRAFDTLDLRSFDQIEADINEARQAYEKLAKSGVASSKELARAQERLTAKVRELKREASGVGEAFDNAKGAIIGVGAALFGVGAVLTSSAKKFGDFNLRMAEVESIAKLGEAGIAEMSKEVRELALELGRDPSELAAALYEIISAEVPVSKSLKVLEASAKAAIAGLTDTKTAVTLGVGVLNAYGKEADDLDGVLDQLFQTVNFGNTTFPELSKSLGDVLATAKGANVPLDALNASIATLTSRGIRTPQAITGLKGAINALAAPTDTARKALDRLGISYDGLINTIGQIAKLDLSLAELRELVPDVEARNAVLALSGSYDKLLQNLDRMWDAAGATGAAYETIADTPARQMAEFRAQLGELSLALGQAAAAFTPVVQALTGLIGEFNALPQSVRVGTAGLLGIVAIVAPLAFAFSKLRGAIGLLVAALATSLPRAAATTVASMRGLGTAAATMTANVAGAESTLRRLGPALRALGWAAVIIQITRVTQLLRELGAASANEEQALARLDTALGGLTVRVRKTKEELASYADQVIVSNEALIAASEHQVELYLESLANAAKYYRALAVQQGLNSDASDEARQKAEEYAQALDAARATVESYNKQEEIRAERILAVGAAIDRALGSGGTAADAIAASLDDIKGKSIEAFGALIEGLDQYARYSTQTGEQVKEGLGGALEDLSEDQLAQFERRARLAFASAELGAQGLERALDAVATARLDNLGADLDALSRGFSDTEAEAVASIDKIISSLDELELAGKERSTAFVAAFNKQLEGIKTPDAIKALKEELSQAFEAGSISAGTYNAALRTIIDSQQEVEDELVEIKTKGEETFTTVEKGAEDAGKGLKKLGDYADPVGESFDEIAEAAEAAAGTFAGVITQWNALGGSVAKLLNDMVALTAEGSTLIGFSRELAQITQIVNEKFTRSAAAADEVIEAYDSGARSAMELRNAALAAASGVQTLDQQRLDKLQHIIEQAKQEMQAFGDTVAEVLADSELRLLRFQGKQSEIAKRESQQRIAELKLLLDQASPQSDNAASIRQAIENERELLALRLRQIEEEKKAQEERESQAQSFDANEHQRIDQRQDAREDDTFESRDREAQAFHDSEMSRITERNDAVTSGINAYRKELEQITGSGGLLKGARPQVENIVTLKVRPIDRPGLQTLNLTDGQLQALANRILDVLQRSRGVSLYSA